MVSACKVDQRHAPGDPPGQRRGRLPASVSLKPDATAGVVRDEIRLVTNDPETPSIPVPVDGQVRGELSATPSLAGRWATSPRPPGSRASTSSGRSKPFAIARVEGLGDGFDLKAADPARKPLHVLTLTYNPAEGTSPGRPPQDLPDHHRPARRGPARRLGDAPRRALIRAGTLAAMSRDGPV